MPPCRKNYGDEFGIGVAGYPETHPDYIVDDPELQERNYWSNIQYLKEKVPHMHAFSQHSIKERSIVYCNVLSTDRCTNQKTIKEIISSYGAWQLSYERN